MPTLHEVRSGEAESSALRVVRRHVHAPPERQHKVVQGVTLSSRPLRTRTLDDRRTGQGERIVLGFAPCFGFDGKITDGSSPTTIPASAIFLSYHFLFSKCLQRPSSVFLFVFFFVVIPWPKTIKKSRAWIGAQLTICAEK